MKIQFSDIQRLLVFVAHPDDETLACGTLLQRVPSAMVLFAVDGAPSGYGFEKEFGSLKYYSEVRFGEASHAIGRLPHCYFRRLENKDGKYFRDRHLFENLEQAACSLLTIARQYSPDAIVSHAYEGGHIDHDACSFLAKHAANILLLKCFEFPLYWNDGDGKDVFQEFRDSQDDAYCLHPSEAELAVKNAMLSDYKSQKDIAKMFSADKEKFRTASDHDYAHPPWKLHCAGNWQSRRDRKLLLRKFSEFRGLDSPAANQKKSCNFESQ